MRYGCFLKAKGASGGGARIALSRGFGSAYALVTEMNFSHFVRIDRGPRGAVRHFVVHTQNPKFTLELEPDRDAPDRVGRGVIKRVCVPNSWGSDYSQFSQILSAAQDFFAQSEAGDTARR